MVACSCELIMTPRSRITNAGWVSASNSVNWGCVAAARVLTSWDWGKIDIALQMSMGDICQCASESVTRSGRNLVSAGLLQGKLEPDWSGSRTILKEQQYLLSPSSLTAFKPSRDAMFHLFTHLTILVGRRAFFLYAKIRLTRMSAIIF